MMWMCLKANRVAVVTALALVAGLAWTGTAWAGTDLANVAFNKTVTANQNAQGRLLAETASGYQIVSGSTACQIITSELPVTWDLNWAYPSTAGGGWFTIDLGKEYDLSHIEIQPRRNDRWNYITSATQPALVQGAADESMSGAYSFTVPGSLGTSDATYTRSVSDWTGVRYIKIQRTSTLDLTISQIRVFSRVDAWGNFIGDVTATATNTENRGGDYLTQDTVQFRASNLVDHTGMTDQGGPTPDNPTNLVGSPDALSRGYGEWGPGLWMSNSSGKAEQAAVTFDLGGTYNLDQMLIWNFNAVDWATSTQAYVDRTDRGIKQALIEYSADGGDTWTALADTNGASSGNYTIPRAQPDWYDDELNPPSLVGAKDNPYQKAVDMTGIVANQVRITTKGTWGSSYVGLSEVRFYGDLYTPPIPTDIPGDANNDGNVDAVDAKMMADNWGKSGDAAWADGDFNGDLKVDAKDAAIMAANWGYIWSPAAPAETSAVAAVPEPGTGALLLTLLAGLATALRHRRVA
ncbi:MAG: PEP-CTERM sorting domain-containing protein [Pirellulaceae bacterium]|nr:PEP-CTERM sorting domain-containing protein [Pirellulaceae bacterium]